MADINPFRYRTYYYDNETWFYYLQSRYYDPAIGRFINADDIDLLNADGTPLSCNLFAYCMNNPIMRQDPTGKLGIISLMLIGAAVNLTIEYAGQVIKNYRAGNECIWIPNNPGAIVASAFSGALSAIPGGGFVATAVDVVGSAVIECGINSIGSENNWEWSTFGDTLANNIAGAVVSKALKVETEIPQYIRHIKDEAREAGIKGTRKLNQYLQTKQLFSIVKNGFYSDTISELIEFARGINNAK